MPEEIRNNWLNNIFNVNELNDIHFWRQNRNREVINKIHEWIILKINNLFDHGRITPNERAIYYEEYYNNIQNILKNICRIVIKQRQNINGMENIRDTVRERIDVGISMIWANDWNFLFLGKFPWTTTLENQGFWNLYFLRKWNWFWDLLNYLYNDEIRETIINNISDKNYAGLWKNEDMFLSNHKIALRDRVHLCYSFDHSALDDRRCAIIYSKVWEKLLQRLQENQDMELNIILWWRKIPKRNTMYYVDFLKCDDRIISLNDDFIHLLEQNLQWEFEIEVGDTSIDNFKRNAFEFSIMHNNYSKKIRVFLWYESSGRSLQGLWQRNEQWFNNFFGRQPSLWNTLRE